MHAFDRTKRENHIATTKRHRFGRPPSSPSHLFKKSHIETYCTLEGWACLSQPHRKTRSRTCSFVQSISHGISGFLTGFEIRNIRKYQLSGEHEGFLAGMSIDRSCRILWKCLPNQRKSCVAVSQCQKLESSTSRHHASRSFNAMSKTARLAELMQRGQSTLGANELNQRTSHVAFSKY